MLEGININLRLIEREDIPLYHEWINDPIIFGRYNPLIQNSRENLQNFFNEQPSDIVIFVIEKKMSETIIKVQNLKNILNKL